MKYTLITYPHETLRNQSKKIIVFDKTLVKLLEDMELAMREKNGVGIAAPQVDSSTQCFLVHYNETIHTFINPEIIEYSIETGIHEEGCLSVPGVYAEIERPLQIKIKAQDRAGNTFELNADSFFARIIQHEIDHLNGILFFDHINKGAQRRLIRTYKKIHSEYTPPQEKKIKNNTKI